MRDIVVYDHRILRLIPMGQGRETTLSLSLKTVRILVRSINGIYIRGHRGIWCSKLIFVAYCDASREGEGDRGKNVKKKRLKMWKKNVYHILFFDVEHESLQGVSSYCAKCLPCDPRIWGGMDNNWFTAYSSLYVFTERSASVDGILLLKILYKLLETTWYLFPYAYPRTGYCRRGGVHTVQQKRLT